MQVATITQKRPDTEQLFEELYLNAFPKVARYVAARKGTLDDAQDIFQDALVIWHEQCSEKGFVPRLSAEAYVIGIAKHMWLRKAGRSRKHEQLADVWNNIAMPGKEANVNINNLLQLLETTGKKCMDLLRSFYYGGKNATEIAQAHNYSSGHSATVQKYKCLEKVRDTVKEKSLSYEAFID